MDFTHFIVVFINWDIHAQSVETWLVSQGDKMM